MFLTLGNVSGVPKDKDSLSLFLFYAYMYSFLNFFCCFFEAFLHSSFGSMDSGQEYFKAFSARDGLFSDGSSPSSRPVAKLWLQTCCFLRCVMSNWNMRLFVLTHLSNLLLNICRIYYESYLPKP